MPYALIDVMAQIVLVTSSAYLLMRSLGMMLRLRRAKNAYPKEVPIANSTPEAGLKSGRYDRHRGVLVGLAVGDALGLPAESLPPWLLPLRYRRGPRMQRGLVRFFRRAGAISDDTQLSICVARSISPEGSYLHERFRDELCLWYGYRIAAGRATTQAVRRLRRGNRDDPGDPKSEGNGAAIRVAPLAMAHAEDLDDTDLIADVKDNARLTHRADKAVSGSVFWALLVWEALRHPRSEMSHDALEGLFVDLARRSCFPVDPALAAARLDLPIADRLRRVGTSGHVVESIHAAIVVLLHHGWHDYPGALETIFWAGGDTDSIGSMVGAVIGAQVGLAGIPLAWGDRVAHRSTLIALADRLALRRA